MLMRIREQKGWIRGIFIALVVVFASSFVIGGVGSGSNFSLSDIIGNGGGSSTPATGSVAALQKQIKLHPKNGALWAQLSEAYSTASQLSLSITAAERSVALRPNNTDGRKTLAGLYQARANQLNSEAQAIYTEAYDLSQSDPSQSPFQAIPATSTSPLAGAVEDPFTAAQSATISTQINTLETSSNKLAVQAQSLNTKAFAQYHVIVNRNVGDAQNWLSYATAAEQAGNNKAALQGYQTFLKLVPADPIAPQVRTKVKSLEKTLKKAAGTTTTPTTTSGSSG